MHFKQLQFRILRRREVLDRFGIANTCLLTRISEGLVPPHISLGGRAVGWPEHEIDQVLAAFVAGRSPEFIKALVRKIITAREHADKPLEANQ